MNQRKRLVEWIGLFSLLLLIGCEQPPSQVSLGDFVSQIEQSDFSGAILVAQNDEILLETGAGWADEANQVQNTAQTVFDSGSLSKQFTAAAVLTLVEQGQIELEGTLADYLDRVSPDKSDITIHQLLTHSSGLAPYVYEGDFVETDKDRAQTLAMESALELGPGSEYMYSDTGYGMLAILVEEVSGQSFVEYLDQQIFQPAGMTQTGFYNQTKWENLTVANGYSNQTDFGSAADRPGPYWSLLGFGGVLTTVGDLYKWSQALDQNLILNASSTEVLFSPHILEYKNGESYYGYGWVIEEPGGVGKLIWHDGATDSQNSFMMMMPDQQNTVIIVLSNRIDSNWVSETFYATDTGFALTSGLLNGDFSELPRFAR
ncbi:MAG: serine hydrolase domain-containing protein [Chloroflexota bacterium]